jgi:hypothetical protein
MAGMVDALARRLKALPDGALLRFAFLGLVGLAGLMVATDLSEMLNGEAATSVALPALDPVRMDRPARNDQIRPYLPSTRPIAPDEGGADLRNRPREDSEAAPMHFRLGTHGAAFAEGTIVPGTADALDAFLASERAASVTEIVLHSPGGSVAEAMAMARLIREKGLGTRILPDGYCASSCPLVFAGGKARIADANSWIGVHQAFAATSAFGSLADGMDQGQRVGADAQNLLTEFGVDPLVWTRAMATPPDKLYLFTPAELTKLKLATEVEHAGPDAGRAVRS